jgi:hypothetical protein
MNLMIRLLLIPKIKKLGFRTITQKTTWIKNLVFFFYQYFNTVVCILLVNCRLSSLGMPFVFNGEYSDFGYEWYREIGVILTQIMLYMAIYPVVEIAVIYVYK